MTVIEQAFIRGFVKAAAGLAVSNSVSRLAAKPNIGPLGVHGMNVSYAPPSGNPISHNINTPSTITPGQISNFTKEMPLPANVRDGLSGWQKEVDYVNANPLSRTIGFTPRPILNHGEQQAANSVLDDTPMSSVFNSVKEYPADYAKTVGAVASSPPAAASILSRLSSLTAGAGRGSAVLGGLAKAAPPLRVAGLLSGLANEARELPEQVVNAGGYGNFLNQNSNDQSNWSTLPGYAAHAVSNLGKPSTSIAGVVNDTAGTIKNLYEAFMGSRRAGQMQQQLNP